MTCPPKRQGEVRIAFIIMTSDHSWKGAPEISVLQELLKALDDPAFFIFIHLDENSSLLFKVAVRAMAEQQPTVILVQHPMQCTWGGQSIPTSSDSALKASQGLPVCRQPFLLYQFDLACQARHEPLWSFRSIATLLCCASNCILYSGITFC